MIASDPPIVEGLGDLLFARAASAYDPWRDLASKTGVDVQWSATGSIDGFDSVLGVTDFNDLRVTLRLGMAEAQLRTTVAHECLHLDRGPLPIEEALARQRYEERSINLIVAKRLVDPIIFDALRNAAHEPTVAQAARILRVDRATFRIYSTWRGKCKDTTALQAWEQARNLKPSWPPAWLDGRLGASTDIAARWARGSAHAG